jgi:hypothetical protein
MALPDPDKIVGTPAQLAGWLAQLPAQKRYRLVEVEEAEAGIMAAAPTRVSAMGKYAGLLNSEEFMRRKHEETEREDRPIL